MYRTDILTSKLFFKHKQINKMKAQINFNFKDGNSIKNQFDLTEGNVSAIATEIGNNFAKKVFLLKSDAAKYFKKSNVLSHRKFSMDIFIEGKHVKTVFSGIETGNGLVKDQKALEELLQIMLFDAMDKVELGFLVGEVVA